MIVTSLFGGLGNQLFQYAAGRALSLRHGVPLKVDTTQFQGYHRPYLLPSLGISLPEATEAEKRSCRLLVETDPFRYDPRLENAEGDILLQGYWQSYQYAKMAGPQLIPCTLPTRDSTVAVHVRRGDYIGNSDVDGICDQEYYDRAMEFMRHKHGQVSFKAFSDDVGWLSKWAPADTVIVDEKDPVKAFLMMASCAHQIIANSTFGWWAAWANPMPGKTVIAPVMWHRRYLSTDLYPEGWVLL